jgi:HNH endonuclease
VEIPANQGLRGADQNRTGVCDRNAEILYEPLSPANAAVPVHHTRRYGHAWSQTRKRILAERGRKCERCDSKDRPQVHHLTYERVGQEAPTDLIVLCHRCHVLEHMRTRRNSTDPFAPTDDWGAA